MKNVSMSRRRFLTASGVAGAGLLVSGCDALDAITQRGGHMRGILESAEWLNYRAQRLLVGDSLAQEFTEADIRQPMRPNGVTHPQDADYLDLQAAGFESYRLAVEGLVERPLSLSLGDVRAMPARTQITRHDCVEGWSCIANGRVFRSPPSSTGRECGTKLASLYFTASTRSSATSPARSSIMNRST